jgi:hypothetical protein
MKLIRLPAVHQNLMVAFATRDFVHMCNGTMIRGLNNDNLEAAYKRTGEEKERYVLLHLPELHYNGISDSGFCFGQPVHNYSDLPKKSVDE